MFEYLPCEVVKEIKKSKIVVNELRIRANAPSFVKGNGQAYKLSYLFTCRDIEEIVLRACKRSIYSYEEQIKQGYITTDYGERIGLAGEFCYDKGNLLAIKNFTSLCIRIPNIVQGFSNEFFNKYYENKSVLIFSPCGVGKTTFLRDLTLNISNKYACDIVVIDERNEICQKTKNSSINVGKSVDVLTYASKDYGFTCAIRTLNPEIVVTDELITKSDYKSVEKAHLSGLKILATMHADSILDIKSNILIKNALNLQVFDKFIQIEKKKDFRQVTVYSKDFEKLCCYLN